MIRGRYSETPDATANRGQRCRSESKLDFMERDLKRPQTCEVCARENCTNHVCAWIASVPGRYQERWQFEKLVFEAWTKWQNFREVPGTAGEPPMYTAVELGPGPVPLHRIAPNLIADLLHYLNEEFGYETGDRVLEVAKQHYSEEKWHFYFIGGDDDSGPLLKPLDDG